MRHTGSLACFGEKLRCNGIGGGGVYAVVIVDAAGSPSLVPLSTSSRIWPSSPSYFASLPFLVVITVSTTNASLKLVVSCPWVETSKMASAALCVMPARGKHHVKLWKGVGSNTWAFLMHLSRLLSSAVRLFRVGYEIGCFSSVASITVRLRLHYNSIFMFDAVGASRLCWVYFSNIQSACGVELLFLEKNAPHLGIKDVSVQSVGAFGS